MNDLKPTFYLKDLLDVDPLENDVFLGHRLSLSTGRVFGGQVLAQALMAASKTVDSTKQVHSCHNYFIRPGNSDLPIHYHVYRDLDGRKFSNRRVVALQNDKPVFSLTASFQAQTDGYAHQIEMPDMPSPEELLNENQIADLNQDVLSADIYKMLNRYRPIDLRPMGGEAHFIRSEKKMTQANWFRAKEPLPDNQALHRGVLAYSTDLTLLSTSGRPHDVLWMDEHVVTASIDHSLWIHSDNINVNEWLLYVMDTPWTGNSRGLNRGSIFTQSGELIASVAQEGLIRITE
ncbi:acyl-CoA thioesterase II [Oceaniserpentilla sp. 4NH20-0058]|uniref:acyl-CoA thioesterase n=1 Tax=Oceaniserpentilla sp. 4NH20-0058 TaxID=3127660 RepID=UPI0031064D50